MTPAWSLFTTVTRRRSNCWPGRARSTWSCRCCCSGRRRRGGGGGPGRGGSGCGPIGAGAGLRVLGRAAVRGRSTRTCCRRRASRASRGRSGRRKPSAWRCGAVRGCAVRERAAASGTGAAGRLPGDPAARSGSPLGVRLRGHGLLAPRRAGPAGRCRDSGNRDGAVLAVAEAAAAAADRLGYPAVVKVDHPELIHKSDAGGVRLGLGPRRRRSRAAAGELLGLADGAAVLVQHQHRGGRTAGRRGPGPGVRADGDGRVRRGAGGDAARRAAGGRAGRRSGQAAGHAVVAARRRRPRRAARQRAGGPWVRWRN